jgi:signal peptidase I
MGLLLDGAAHFLSGARLSGVIWFAAITISATISLLIMSIPGFVAYLVSIGLLLLSGSLWTAMMIQSYRNVPRIGVLGWIMLIGLSVIVASGWSFTITSIVRPFSVSTGAMSPTIVPGDHLMAESVSYMLKKPQRGDIIVFATSGIDHPHVRQDTYYVKRIAGMPGERIQIDPPYLLVNGIQLTEPESIRIISHGPDGFHLAHAPPGIKAHLRRSEDYVELGEDEYFVIGDNTTSSLDSRYYGPIKAGQIVGRMSRIYWPLSRAMNGK